MNDTFYITTPIYYVNAEPHLGHAYTTIVADVASRFHRLLGQKVRFQTGTDEHGDKIVEAAEKNGVQPKEYVDRISGMFRDTWPHLNISNDNFIRTTDPDHIKVVQALLQKVYDKGDIYFAKYGGNYCVACERFLTDKELVDGKCPDHGTEPQYIEEENYFFRMSNYQAALVDHIKANPDFIRPERYRNEILSMLSEPLDDLCISRPKTRLTWGIEMPFDDKFVTYVWFDALINYISGLGWPDGVDYQTFWPGQHLIAKDILKPHAVFWPTMLMSMELPLYRHLNVHGYWNVDQAKMSKSLGNVVRPLELVDVYGVDAFRYFVMREMVFGLDSSFSELALVERYNADLANDLGNLFSRVLNMLDKYHGGALPEPGPAQQADQDLAAVSAEAKQALIDDFQGFAFHKGLAKLWELISAANKYVVANEPWVLAKDEAQAPRLNRVMYTLVQALADIAVMVWPVMPGTAQAMADHLGLGDVQAIGLDKAGLLGLIPAGRQIGTPPALFPRVDTAKVQAKAKKAEEKAQAKQEPKPKKSKSKKPSGPAEQVTIDEFAAIDLKVGRILEAARVEGTDKLMHLSVDLGEESPRSIVAGIALAYGAADLPGKEVVVVANLKPAKLRGIESHGMCLAATGPDGKLKLIDPGKGMAPGSTVR